MKNLDNTIKYYELLMKYDDVSNFKKYKQHKGIPELQMIIFLQDLKSFSQKHSVFYE